MLRTVNLNSFVKSTFMRRLLYLVVIIFLLCLSCRNNHKSAAGIHEMTIAALNGPSAMAFVKLTDSLRSSGDSRLKVVVLDEPLQVRKMMFDGTADFALLPTTMAAILYNKGLDYRLLAIPVWGTLYLAGTDTTITSMPDLRGRHVNVMARGMTPDVLFRDLLEKSGIDPDNELTLDYSFPAHTDLANALAAGQADLGVMSEPMVSLITARNRKMHVLIDLNSEWDSLVRVPLAQTAFLVKGGILKNDSEMVERVIAACRRSVEWVNNNPDSAAALTTKYGILPDSAVAVEAIPRSNMKFIRARDIIPGIEEYLAIFYRMDPDIIGGKLPDEDFYY